MKKIYVKYLILILFMYIIYIFFASTKESFTPFINSWYRPHWRNNKLAFLDFYKSTKNKIQIQLKKNGFIK